MAEAGSVKTGTSDENTDASENCSKTKLSEKIYSDKPKIKNKKKAISRKQKRPTKSVNCEFDYVVVDSEETLKESLKSIDAILKDDPIVALDCEGDDLSRVGKIQLVSIATQTKAFLIDILALKTAPFEQGLRDILESKSIKKLMFDCREDSDALFHQFNVRVDGVIDIQLLEVIKRSGDLPTRTSGRRSDRCDEVVRVKGLLSCIGEFLGNVELVELKRRASTKMGDWGKRPLEKWLIEYATVDVMSLFLLFDNIHPGEEEMKRLQIASNIYVDLKRSIPHREYNKYENNGYLPIDVIPEKGQTGFEYGYISCTKCRRKFPNQEFSKSQLKKANQLCRTCKEVKLDIDTHESRMRNYEINSMRREMRRERRRLYEFSFDDEYEEEYVLGFACDCENYSVSPTCLLHCDLQFENFFIL